MAPAKDSSGPLPEPPTGPDAVAGLGSFLDACAALMTTSSQSAAMGRVMALLTNLLRRWPKWARGSDSFATTERLLCDY